MQPAPASPWMLSMWLALLACSTARAEPLIGEHTSPILRGRKAQPSERYGTVAIVDHAHELVCTGTLIGPRLVLSAAHCVVEEDDWGETILRELSPSELFVIAGPTRVDDATERDRYAIATIVRHARYPGDLDVELADPDGLGDEHDLSLLFLTRDVEAIAPVAVVESSQLAMLRPGDALLLSGYGDRDLAGTRYGELYVGSAQYVRRNEHELVIGKKGESDTCYGDSGGPAYLLRDGVATLLGVTARPVLWANADCGEGGIYTLAPAYQRWIEQEAAHPQPVPASLSVDAGADGRAHLSGGAGCTVSSTRSRMGMGALVALLVAWLALRRGLVAGQG